MDEFSHVAFREVAASETDLAIPEIERDVETENELVEWLKIAVKLTGKAPIIAAIMIRDRAIKLDRLKHIMLTPDDLSMAGLGRVTAYRALVELENAELVTVNRSRGRSPVVCIQRRPGSGD